MVILHGVVIVQGGDGIKQRGQQMCVGCFSTTAYAQRRHPYQRQQRKGGSPRPAALDPGGHMILVDDISSDAAGDKQFIVVQSKSGNYFTSSLTTPPMEITLSIF